MLNKSLNNYKKQKLQKVPTAKSTNTHMVKDDEYSNSEILVKHKTSESLLDHELHTSVGKCGNHKNKAESQSSAVATALQKFNNLTAKQRKSVEAQTNVCSKSRETHSQATQTMNISSQNSLGYIATASSSSISALYSNSRACLQRVPRTDTISVKMVPNCDKTHPSSILRGMSKYQATCPPHILGYYPRNRSQNREGYIMGGSCSQLNMFKSLNNLYKTYQELSTLV